MAHRQAGQYKAKSRHKRMTFKKGIKEDFYLKSFVLAPALFIIYLNYIRTVENKFTVNLQNLNLKIQLSLNMIY